MDFGEEGGRENFLTTFLRKEPNVKRPPNNIKKPTSRDREVYEGPQTRKEEGAWSSSPNNRGR